MSTANDKIVLGSGKLYTTLFTGTVPTIEDICKEENRIGYIQGGATMEYTPSYYEAKDDLGYAVKTIMTEENAVLKTGIMTFTANTLEKLCETGRVTEENGKRTIKIGGIGNATHEKYVVCFHHEDAVDGDIWIVIVGQNQAGFSLAFAKDKETVIDAEFKALPNLDGEGTLIQYIEEIKTAATE